MPLSLLAVVVDCQDSRSQAGWWGGVLGRQVSERNAGEFEVSDEGRAGTPLYFMNVPEPKVVKDRLHIDVTTDERLEEAVERLTRSGARLVELRQDPATLAHPDRWAVLHDPEGNEFCVFERDSVSGMT